MKYIFTTKLTPSQCLDNIRKYSEEGTFLNQLSTLYDYDKKFFYKIKGNNFRIEKVIYYRNSFKQNFYGKVFPSRDGARIEGEFHMHLLVRIFMTLWFSALFLMLGSIIQKNLTGEILIFLLVVCFFACFGCGLIYFGKKYASKEELAVLDFITTTCKAKLIK